MSNLLALEWDHEQIRGVLAQVSPGRVVVRRCFVLEKPTASSTGSGPAQTGWLKSQLGELGITGGQVVVTLPRDEAVVKRLELPETTDDELPLIVRYQAGTKSSASLDELYLDFIPLPRRSEVLGREVLMATLLRQTADEIHTACEFAGLQVVSLGLTPVAMAELVARVEPVGAAATGESLVVARHGKSVEISVLRGQHLLFSHSARLSDDALMQVTQAMAAEASRAMVALRGSISEVKIERVWVLCEPSEYDPLAEALHRRLGCESRLLDPYKMVECEEGAVGAGQERTLFAGPIGNLLSRAEHRVPAIDFLAPRQPPVKRDVRKQRMIVAAAAAAVLVLAVGGAQWLRVYDLAAEIERLTKQDNQLTATLKAGEPIRESEALVDQWMAGDAHWLDELAELTERFPSSERVYLESLKFDPKLGASAARIKAEGFARERADVMKFGDKFLSEDGKYRVLPHGDRPATGDNYYPRRFESEILLVEPAQKQRSADANQPKTQTGGAQAKATGGKTP